MDKVSCNRPAGMLFAGISALLITGCGQQGEQPNNDATPAAQTTTSDQESHSHEHSDHSGWWCVEHAIPEDVCSMCSPKAADEFKAKGDWCEEHNRADSQCFICHPENAEQFSKLYEAKFGHAPPAPEI